MDGDADFTVAQNEQQPLLADSKKPCKEVNCKTVTKRMSLPMSQDTLTRLDSHQTSQIDGTQAATHPSR
jgi:hypothetical protein